MYLHRAKNGHYTPPCCYFSGELEVVEILRFGFCGNEYTADLKQLEANLPSRCASAYRAMKYQELLQEFQYAHSGLITLDEIARMNSIEKHFVDFKLNILADKGYQLPFLPELHNDFLKDSLKNCNGNEVTMD